MTEEVVSLADERQKRSPHISGAAKCLACQHRWMAVAPTGTIWLDCPSCTLERGRFIAQCEAEGPHLHCPCGCDLFYVHADYIYCPNCGMKQDSPSCT